MAPGMWVCSVAGILLSASDNGVALECPLQWSYIAWAGRVEDELLSSQQAYLSTQPVDPRERRVSILLGLQQRRRSCRSGIKMPNHLRDSSSWFSVGFYPPSLSQSKLTFRMNENFYPLGLWKKVEDITRKMASKYGPLQIMSGSIFDSNGDGFRDRDDDAVR